MYEELRDQINKCIAPTVYVFAIGTFGWDTGMDISIIVPFFKAQEYISQCIEGILGQDYPSDRFEIIMVDNNSPDACAQIVRRYPRIRLFREFKQGAYAARNLGAMHARGDILAFTDPDCVPKKNWLKGFLEAMQDPAVQVAVGPSTPAGNSTALKLIGKYEQEKESYILSSPDPTIYWGHTNNMAVGKKIWDEFGPFRERKRGADVIFVRKVVDATTCDVIRYAPAAMVDHLEIKNLSVYFNKIFIYGKSRRQYSRIKYSRPLTNRERLSVFRRTSRKYGLSRVERGFLFLLLLNGVVFWYAGNYRGALEGSI